MLDWFGSPRLRTSQRRITSRSVAVPDVVGDEQSAAEAEIEAAGLTVDTVTNQASADVPAGNVISQNPEAGTSVAPGSRVDLVVSAGSDPPDVPQP
jgi:serine/threonine-protein kinase